MKRSTKRVVGWGSGVAIGVVLILIAVVLMIAMNGAPSEKVEGHQLVSADTEIDTATAPQDTH